MAKVMVEEGASYLAFIQPGWIIVMCVTEVDEDRGTFRADAAWLDGVNGDYATTDVAFLPINVARNVPKRFRIMEDTIFSVSDGFFVKAKHDLRPLLGTDDLAELKGKR